MFQVTIYRAPEWGIKALEENPYFTNLHYILKKAVDDPYYQSQI